MYCTHVPLLAKHARTPAGFADVVIFAIATQQQYFYAVPDILDDLKQMGTSTRLNKRQLSGIAFVRQHASLFLPHEEPKDVDAAMRRLLELPSIGFVKAGFVLQMCGYNIGCLDVHMCRMAGVKPGVFHRIPASTEGLTCRIANYIMTCHALGGTEHLWNSWCEFIAQKYPSWFSCADAVSSSHVSCVMGERV